MSKWKRREYQIVALAAARMTRTLGLYWARQCRKSTTLGDIAFDEMSREPGRRVIAASASLLLGTELVTKAVSAAEQAIIVAREATAMQASFINSLADTNQQVELTIADSSTGKLFKALSGDDFTDLYMSGRLEMRLYHDRAHYSRLQVIAPNPATARGWSGTVLRDEVGYVVHEAHLQEAVKPITDTDKTFRMIYASNLPFDDRHPWFEMTLPADPSLEFQPNSKGNMYRSQTGLRVHRVALCDAYAAGHVLYNDDADEMTLEQVYAAAIDKGALRRSYQLIHEYGGASAIDLISMTTSQQRGVGKCACISVDTDSDMDRACRWLTAHLGAGTVGIGVDVATTTKVTSNPTSVTVTEAEGVNYSQPLVVTWKERKPQVARERLRRIIQAVAARPLGGKARRLCIDATSERYFAEETSDMLRGLIPIKLVVSSESVHPSGYKSPTNYKTWLGDLYSAEINENHYSLPPESYLKDDHRLVIKDRGMYNADPQPDGKHGDTFDSGKLAQYALFSGGPADAVAAQVGTYGSVTASPKSFWRPNPMEDATISTGKIMT